MTPNASEIETYEQELEALLNSVMQSPLQPFYARIDGLDAKLSDVDAKIDEIKKVVDPIIGATFGKFTALERKLNEARQQRDDEEDKHFAWLEECGQSQEHRLEEALARIDGLAQLVQAQAAVLERIGVDVAARLDAGTTQLTQSLADLRERQHAMAVELSLASQSQAELVRDVGDSQRADGRRLGEQLLSQITITRQATWRATALAGFAFAVVIALLVRNAA